uniref:NADH dehydrogenase subunit 6 n=1 Tax=Scopura montana TaxID=143739 RepID=UPI002551EBFF|nr:NADH dehydrogenase subunit 6 [Scopura montana]WGC89466.1 NADH dehydrogenase subunit 6 [Scopura montana]
MYSLLTVTASLITSMIFTQMTHPLAMGLMLLLQTLIICLMTGLMTQTFWFSYILFLVFLGGLLVLFIYVTSLASNEMFIVSTKMTILTLIPLLTLLLIYLFMDPLTYLMNMFNNDMLTINYSLGYPEESILSLMKLYNQPTQLITLMLVLYLFLTLIAVVTITSIFQGPLRPKN